MNASKLYQAQWLDGWSYMHTHVYAVYVGDCLLSVTCQVAMVNTKMC